MAEDEATIVIVLLVFAMLVVLSFGWMMFMPMLGFMGHGWFSFWPWPALGALVFVGIAIVGLFLLLETRKRDEVG